MVQGQSRSTAILRMNSNLVGIQVSNGSKLEVKVLL